MKHHALFTDDYDGEIKPVLFEGRKEEDISESFNTFYNFNMLYDLTMKWIFEEGEFDLNYRWLTNKGSESLTPFLNEGFKHLFGITMDEIIIL